MLHDKEKAYSGISKNIANNKMEVLYLLNWLHVKGINVIYCKRSVCSK